MKNYLEQFFTRFDYPTEAREVLTAAYDLVQADAEGKERFDGYLAAYKENMRCDFGAQIQGCGELAKRLPTSPYTLQLLLFICHSEHLRELYREKGLDEQIWHDSMLDLKYKLFECYEVYGIWGSFVSSWFPRFFMLDTFALGRLQFEWSKFNRGYSGQGVQLTAGARVVNIHIPRSGQPLSAELCDDAFARAAAFYTPQLEANEPLVFVCSSWLLYPPHEDFLPAKSNLRTFMKYFDIISQGTHGGDHPDLWRLFDTKEVNPDRLPANSSLRRAYIDHLKKGGKTGWGHGVFVWNKS